jgi:hypothetical protein
MEAMKKIDWCVLGFRLIIHSVKAPFVPQKPPGGVRWAAGLGNVFPFKLVPFCGNGQVQDSQIGMRHHLNFCLQTVRIEKSSRFKSGKYGSHSTGVPSSAKSGWVVMAVRAGTKSTGRHIFRQNTSHGPLGHMVSQKLLGDVGVDQFSGKTCVAGLNPKSAGIASFCPFTVVQSVKSSKILFILKTRLMLALMPAWSSYGSVPLKALSDELVASDLHGDREIAYPQPPHLRSCLDCHLLVLLILPLTVPKMWCWWAYNKQSMTDCPTLNYHPDSY